MGIGERTVLVDIDGVMADFESPNDAIIRTHFPEIALVTDRKNFYYKDTYRDYEAVRDTIYRENRRPGFFRSFPVVDGAIEGWKRILDAGYTPRVCSSPLEDHPTVIPEKIDWLEEFFVPQFGAWVVDTAIFDRDKSGYDAFGMTDDHPSARGKEKARWEQIVFNRSYNQDVVTDFRLEGWHDPALEHLLQAARQKYLTRFS